MSTRALYHPRNLEVDLAKLPTWLYGEIASLHGQITRADPPVLTCLGNHQPMYVWRSQSGRYFIRHFPNENPDGHHHDFSTAMSDEHQREADYVARAAADHGFDAPLEKSTGNGTRLDVAVFGDVQAGFEIQRSALSRRLARSRAAKSFDAGWPTAWVSDREPDPDWAGYVPTARLVTRGIWSERMPPRGSAEVAITRFTRERVGLHKWNYRGEPRAVTLDELAYLMPAGEIVPVQIGKQGRAALAFQDALEIIDSCTYPGASRWQPTSDTRRHKEATQRYTTECHHDDVPSVPPSTERQSSPDGYDPQRAPLWTPEQRRNHRRCHYCEWHPPTQGHQPGCPAER